jgi:tetratricopeptide (TPR) repeat protein
METPASSLSFAALLKRYRRAAGLTQEALAERAGYSTAYLSKLEQGARRPLALTVEVLTEALHLAPSERSALAAAAERPAPTIAHTRPLPRDRPHSVRASLPPLIGRSAERTRLARFLAGDGPPLLMVAGEPGIGKTRLLQEAISLGQGQWLSILTGGCHRRSDQEPYAPFITTLAEALAQRSPNEQRHLLAGCEWLARLLPELAEHGLLSAPTWTLPPAQERRLMFVAVGRLLANMAGPAGALLVLDDLHWAGADALDLLATLVRSAVPSCLRVIGAYRQTEVGREEPLSLLMTDLMREGRAQRIELGPLAPEEATILLTNLLEHAEDEQRAAVERVLARAGGMPYFLVSCAQGLQAGTVEAQAGTRAEDALPQNVMESIRQRVALLPEAAQYLLGAAAMAGGEIPRALLLALAAPLEWRQQEVLVALDRICHARLLVEQDEESYAFAHDLIREVVGADMGAARRAVLHQQLAAALEDQPGEPPVEQLADHYRQAGLLEKAVVYLERAGDRAKAMYAHREAARAYQELVQALTRLGQSVQVATAQEKLAGALGNGARYSEGLGILEEALLVYQTAQDVEGQARVIAKIGQLHAARGSSTDGTIFLEKWLASSQASEASIESRGMLYLTLAYLFHNSGRYSEALVTAEQAADMAQQVQDHRLLGKARWHIGRDLMLLGRAEEAIPFLEAALPIAEQVGDLRDLFYIFLNLSLVSGECGELREGVRYAERAIALAEQMGDPFLLAQVLATYAFNQFVVGEWQRSRPEYERAIGLMRQAGMPWGATYPLLGLGQQLLAEGQEEAGRALLAEALSLAGRDKNPEAAWNAQNVLAAYDLFEGHPHQARERLEPLLEDAKLEENHVIALLPTMAWSYLELGNAAQAEALVEQARAGTRAGRVRLVLLDVLHVQARIAARRQNWQEAEQALEEMRLLAQTIPCPYDEAKAHYVAGLVAAQQEKAAQARVHFEEALAILHRLGERLYAEQIEQALAASTLPKAPPFES